MTRSPQKQDGTVRTNTKEAVGFYVYCIGEPYALRTICKESLPVAIEEEMALELVVMGNLAAVISKVPLAMYGEDSLTEHLTDPSWTASRAMRHEQVVEHFAQRASVVPLRFGTIYLESKGVEQMLADKDTELHEIIERLREREEWGVNLFCDRAKLMAIITSLSPRLRDMTTQAEEASPGQSYLLKKKIETLRADEARVEIARLVDIVEDALKQQSEAGKRLRVLKVEASEHGELKAKFAFLIRRSSFERFRASAERLARENQAAGLRLELTGPWPAYNFTMDS